MKAKKQMNAKIIKSIFLLILVYCGLSISNFTFAVEATNEGVATPSEVLVVYNSSYTVDSNSNGTQDSLEIANYYKNKRSIPAINVMSIAISFSETISRTNYNTYIKTPIENYLTANNLANSIKYIVVVKGIPLKVSQTNYAACHVYTTNYDEGNYLCTDYASVDSSLCLLYQTYDTTWVLLNPYFSVDANYSKAYRFKTNHFSYNNGPILRYLVTRLDGYAVSDITGMIDRAYATGENGNDAYWVIDDHQKSYDSMQTAFTKLNNLGRNVNPNPWSDTTAFIKTNSAGPVIGYTSHGIHAGMGDGYVSNNPVNANHLNFTLANGAVFSTYESFNAYGFETSTQSTHGQVAEWIQIGGSGGIGNVYEPWASSIADEAVWMSMYSVGYTWADAAYMSLPYIDFVQVVVGDPLMIITDTTPPDSVSNLSATPGNSSIGLSWTNPGTVDFAGVKILRKTSGYPTNSSDGTVVYTGASTNFTDTNIVNGTTYYYAVFSYDEVPNYSLPSDNSKISATIIIDTAAPNSIANMTAVSQNRQIILMWSNPINADFVGVKILRKTSGYPTNSSDGTVVYNGSEESYADSGLTNGTTYYYSAFAYDAVPNYSSLLTGSMASGIPNIEEVFTVGEPDISPPGATYNMVATPSNGSVALSWSPPNGSSDFAGVRIVKRIDRYPQSPSDGVIVYEGSGATYIDRNVTNAITYFYTAFAYDTNRNYSLDTSNSRAFATPCSGSCTNVAPSSTINFSFEEPDITPPSSIDNFDAVAGVSSVSMTWTNPFNDEDWIGTIIVRKIGSYPNSYSDGVIVCRGAMESFVDSDVSPGTTYYYAALVYDKGGNYSGLNGANKDTATPY